MARATLGKREGNQETRSTFETAGVSVSLVSEGGFGESAGEGGGRTLI